MLRLCVTILAATLATWGHFVSSQTTGGPTNGRCECGIFVPKMYPSLSRIEPLDYVGRGDITEPCSLSLCKLVCEVGAPAWDYDLDIVEEGGVVRGQRYCDAVNALIPGPVNAEALFVTSRIPDCENFLVWSTERLYTSNTTLCCSDTGDYAPC